MKTYIARLKSVSPYSQSKHHDTPRLEREQPQAWEERTWRERMHIGQDGNVFIPPMSIKNCLSDAAKYIAEQIPGKGKATYTKHFEAGVLVVDPIILPLKKEDVPGEWLYVPADGKRGGDKRVQRCFPVIHDWEGNATIHVLDEIITGDVLLSHLKRAGQFIGIGRFRPRRNGFYGRFDVVNFEQADG